MITWEKKVLSPVPRGVGCVCDVTCWWALRLRLVGFAVLGGRGAAGLVPVVSVPALSLVPAVPAV